MDIPAGPDVEALGWREGDVGGALFARREIDSVRAGIGDVSELLGARGGLPSCSAALLLDAVENGS